MTRSSTRLQPEPTVSDTLVNSVCSTHPTAAGCSSMEYQSIDRAWQCSCAGLGANSGQSGAVLRLRARLRAERAVASGSGRTETMELLRVEGIAMDARKPADSSKMIPGNWGKIGSGWWVRSLENPVARPGGGGSIHQLLWRRSRAVSNAKSGAVR
jgi:hypothetical protein